MKYLLLVLFLIPNVLLADASIEDYRKYNTTKTKFNLQKTAKGLENPWALTFIDKKNIVVTEKDGGLYRINVLTGEKQKIKHNIPHIGYDGGGQGGLLDVYFNPSDGYTYFTYSHKSSKLTRSKQLSKKSSTAIARGRLVENEIKDFEILLIAKPEFLENRHYGSRIVIKGDDLFSSFGERGQGMISQDPSKHPGSIIRIKTDGTIPQDNPRFKEKKEWLPEIYMIGVRNPQGIAISPHDDEIYFSSHGPRGGDHIGEVQFGSNYGWKDIAWGGREYYGLGIGDAPFKDKYKKPLISWVPSMGISSIQFYAGKTFPEWQGDLLVASLNGQSLIRLDLENSKIIAKEIIFKDKIGRIRDFKIDYNGDIYLISDSSESYLWKLSKIL
ncbi:PQQ-dependent sugar dehydrogenase [Methylophilaceae bacterium]|nr:PQQ-dependent sugar dehydrogenase [Methylophilaceae bacterium]